jgi:hypothetical protein
VVVGILASYAYIYISSLLQPHLSSLLFCNIEGYIRFLPTEIGTLRDYSKVVFSRNFSQGYFRIGSNRCLNAVSHKERLYCVYKNAAAYKFKIVHLFPRETREEGPLLTVETEV